MSREVVTISISPEDLPSTGNDLRLSAAHVGQESAGRQSGTEQFDEMKNRADWGRKDYDVTAADGVSRICFAFIDRTFVVGSFQHGRAITAHDAAMKAVCLERQT
jgi:hypothetical protein